jgi:hypothetical protein
MKPPSAIRRPLAGACRPAPYRPQVETLESRCLPSTVDNLLNAGLGSLRQAITDTPSGGTVDFQPGLTGTITLTSGELLIDKDLTIAGPGAEALTVSGNHASRVFEIAATFTVDISGLTIANGTSNGGGGVLSAGTLTLSSCLLSNNSATGTYPGGNGGGIYNTGVLTVTASTLSGNAASGASGSRGSGGGIYNAGAGPLTVTASTLSGNAATGGAGGVSGGEGSGGGIYNAGAGPLTVTASTLSGNAATGGSGSGGGIYNAAGALAGPLTVTACTLSGNAATGGGGSGSGGGISGSLTALRNTIVAGNTASSAFPEVNGPVGSQGHNLIGDGTGGSGFAPSDMVGTSANPIDPVLGPLQDNGGPAPTMALLVGSPAIGAGDNTDALPTDQRGAPRIFDGAIDIGAYEVQAAPAPSSSVLESVLRPHSHRLRNVGLGVQLNEDADPNARVRVQVYGNDGARASDARESVRTPCGCGPSAAGRAWAGCT